MQWKVYMDTQGSEYHIRRVERKDQEEKVLYTTSSGEFFVEVEANSEEEAKWKALRQVLEQRVEELHRILFSRNETLKANEIRQSTYISAMHSFMGMIREGDLCLADTGSQIVGKWYSRDGIKNLSFSSELHFVDLIQAISNAPAEDIY
jgi:hypothetical protein